MKKSKIKQNKLPVCLGCGVGSCCREGVETDLFEVAVILKQNLSIPRPWFEFKGRDRNTPSGFKFTTVLKNRRCIFQCDDGRCRIYDVRPRYCREFPLENGRKAPYYHHLCYHGKKKK